MTMPGFADPAAPTAFERTNVVADGEPPPEPLTR